MNFEQIYLEESQLILLASLIEAYKKQSPDQREEFLYIRTLGLNEVQHPYLPGQSLSVFHGDMQALSHQNLIIYSNAQQEIFNLSPLAIAYVAQTQQKPVGERAVDTTSSASSSGSTSTENLVNCDQVFIGYSHADKEWLEHLQIMLKPLTRSKRITLWDDTRLRSGDKWREEIHGALAATKVAVMLVSPHFLASDFIAEHELPPLLKAAQEKGVKILWVLVSDCLYNVTELADFQAAHEIKHPLDSLSNAERNRVIKAIALQIAEAANDPNPQ